MSLFPHHISPRQKAIQNLTDARTDHETFSEMTHYKFLILMGVFCAFFGLMPIGCISTFQKARGYEGEKRLQSETAVIKGETGIYIFTLNDKSINNYLEPPLRIISLLENAYVHEIELLPGRYELSLRHNMPERYELFRINSSGFYISPVLWLQVEANHTYVGKSLRKGYSAYFWIEDTSTGKVVSGIKDGPDPDQYAPTIASLKSLAAESRKKREIANQQQNIAGKPK